MLRRSFLGVLAAGLVAMLTRPVKTITKAIEPKPPADDAVIVEYAVKVQRQGYHLWTRTNFESIHLGDTVLETSWRHDRVTHCSIWHATSPVFRNLNGVDAVMYQDEQNVLPVPGMVLEADLVAGHAELAT